MPSFSMVSAEPVYSWMFYLLPSGAHTISRAKCQKKRI